MKKIIIALSIILCAFSLYAQSYENWERLDRQTIRLQNGSTTITRSGVYELTGILNNGMVTVSTNDTGTVYLVLDNAHLTGNNGSPLYIEKANNVVIILEDKTSNTIRYTGQDNENDDLPDAALYSRANLTIAGEGVLSINATYVDAIKSKENLELEDITLILETPEDAIDSDGDIHIKRGMYTINAGDDAIHSEAAVTIDGGIIDIQTCVEGIEGAYVTINAGDIDIYTTDDAINTPEDYSVLTINGGTIYLETHGADTDGIDSNNDLVITGGSIVIKMSSLNRMGQHLDYDGNLTHTGGSIKDENGNDIDPTVRRRGRR